MRDEPSSPSFAISSTASESATWRKHLIAAYRRDALLACTHLETEEIDVAFVQHIIELLRTYIALPDVGSRPLPADDAILQLAHLAAGYLFHWGYGHHIRLLWPPLIELSHQRDDAERYINFVKYLAIVRGRQNDGQAGLALYRQLIADPRFSQASPRLQADILCHVGTVLLWNGAGRLAEPLLHRCLLLTAEHANQSDDTVVYRGTTHFNLGAAPLWETHAYALNQLGVLHMFHGEFLLARTKFDAMLSMFLEHNQHDNLACVAYQAIGRLLLYTHCYTEAITILEQGLVIRRRHQDVANVAINQVYIAAAVLHLQQWSRAESLLVEAHQICAEQENLHDVALCHLYLGELAYARKQWEKMRSEWLTAVSLANEVTIHFIELRLWLRYLWPLLCLGESQLVRKICMALWKSSGHDRLSPLALYRLLHV